MTYTCLVRCFSHCGELCGHLAIIQTDVIKLDFNPTELVDLFAPGTWINFIPLTNGACPALIVAQLSELNPDFLALYERKRKDAGPLSGPVDIVTVQHIHLRTEDILRR